MRLLAYSTIAVVSLLSTSVGEAQRRDDTALEQNCNTPVPGTDNDPEYREHDETALRFMRARREPWPPDVENNKPVPTEVNRFGGAYMVGMAGEDAIVEGDIDLGPAGAVGLRQALMEKYGTEISKGVGQTAADVLRIRTPGAVVTAPETFLASTARSVRLSQTARDLLFSLSPSMPVFVKSRLTRDEATFVASAAREAEAFVQELEATRPDAILAVPTVLGQLWKQLPIKYDASAFGGPRREQIDRAADLWNRATGIKLFTPASGTTSGSYIRLVPGDGCSSFVGQSNRQPQRIKLGNGCSEGAIRHEFGHALGLFHEQSHPERDQFVTIQWQNIKPSARYNFRIATNISKPSAYDYCSIMHYGPKAFGGGKVTIVPKQQGVQIGQREGPSPMDAQMIRALYRKP